MFATRAEIREAVRRKIRAEGYAEGFRIGFREGCQEVIALMEKHGISIPPDVVAEIERLPESHSDHWPYKTFEITTTKAHWAFILPLVALFDWVRTMFATRKEIREAVRRRIRAEVRQEVRAEVRQEVRRETIALMEKRGISIPPDMVAEIERLPEDES